MSSGQKNLRRNQVVNDFKQEFATMFEASIQLYIKEIKLRFEPENLKPLISLYNIVNDSQLNVKDIEHELVIYKEIIDFTSLKNELNLWYQIKEIRNLNSFGKIIDEFRNGSLKVSFPQVLNLILVWPIVYGPN